MKPSSLTLIDMKFIGVRIETDSNFDANGSEFNFEGTLVQWGISHGKRDDSGLSWWVGVDFASKGDEEKIAPYILEIKAAGLFQVNESIPDDQREQFAYEQGAALVFGAIREMVTTVTARSVHGAITLPTASFVGAFAERPKPASDAKFVDPSN